jgi:hypothetical protein
VGAPFDNFTNIFPFQGTDSVDVGSVRTFLTDGSTVGPTIWGTLSGERFGAAVAGFVDVDLDGVNDILVGAPSTDGPTPLPGSAGTGSPRGCEEGIVFIYSGVNNQLISTVRAFGVDDAGLFRGQGRPRFGSAIVGLRASAPNPPVHPSAIQRFVATAPFADLEGVGADAGWAGVYGICPDPAIGLFDFTFVLEQIVLPSQDQAGALFGWSVALIHDTVGIPDPNVPCAFGSPDGLDDFAAGAPLYTTDPSAPNTGAVFIYAGRLPPNAADCAGSVNNCPVYVIDRSLADPSNPLTAGARFGHAIAVHISGLGFPPTRYLLVGAPLNDPTGGGQSGSVFIFSITATGATYVARVDGPQVGSEFGSAIASTGDVDNDGFKDFLVGAPAFDPGGNPPGVGRVYVCSGRPATLGNIILTIDPPASVTIDAATTYTPAAGDRFGEALVGSMNPFSPTRPQIAIGVPGADFTSGGQTIADRGTVLLYSILLGGGITFRLALSNQQDPERSDGDRFGSAIADVADVFGSEQHGLVVGAPFVDAVDPNGRLIRRKGKTYTFTFTDQAPPP